MTFTTRPELRGTFGMVASTHWLASAAGMSVLERGGNAFDAAVAAGFTLQVVEPHLNGPGGEVPAVFWSESHGRALVLCGQGVAPAAATIERFHELGHDLIPGTGLLAACVPGAFGGWLLLLREFGTWRLEDVAPGQAVAVAELHHRAGVQAAGAGGGVVLLLVAPAGDVVLEQPARLAADVVAGEQGDDGEALHGRREVVADHRPQLVGLALEGQDRPLHLLVVLELELEEPDHLHGRAGGARDPDPRQVVGLEDLLHPATRHLIAGGGLTIAGHDHALAIAHGEDGGAVRHAGHGIRGHLEARQEVRGLALQ